VSPLSSNHYNFLDIVYSKHHMCESAELATRHSAYALQMGDKDIFQFPQLTNSVALPIVQYLFSFPPLTQDTQPTMVPLQDYEDAMSVDAGPAGQTPLPAGDDQIDPTPKLTSNLEDPVPEPQASGTHPYLV
jgi:hypothetical protein